MKNTDSTAENPYLTSGSFDFDDPDSLSESDARQQANLLQTALREHDRLYYIESNPRIADRTYDKLFKRLQNLEAEFDIPTENSPTQRVGGAPIDEFDTHQHENPLLSIQQSGEKEDVRAFFDRMADELPGEEITYVCEPKFDGISLALTYENGALKHAVTRGDGEEGDDVTANAKTVPTIPLELTGDYPEHLTVRGELYMPKDGFQRYNRQQIEQGKDPFANPRNATAGTIRQQDPQEVASRPLAFYTFEVLNSSDPWDSRLEEHKAFPSLGLPVSDLVETAETFNEISDYRDNILEERDSLNVAIDGTVIKVNDHDQRETIGYTGSHPRWAFAYKFPPRSGDTTLRDIVLQVGRTGRTTPVALLDPVDVGGVTVSRANLHNPEWIEENDLGIGDKVRVERAGDVIPQVAEVLESNSTGHFTYPDACPICDSPIEQDGPIARCRGGFGCTAQQRRSLEYYASRKALDIDGLGEKTARQLMDAELVTDIADIYELTLSDLTELERMGERSAQKLLDGIEATTEPELGDFMTGLGIRETGGSVSQMLAREFGSFENFREASTDELEQIDEIGPATAQSVRAFFENPDNKDVLDRILEHVTPQELDVETGDAFEDQTIVFTGSIPSYTRSDAKELIEIEGGNVTSSVSGNTDLLVIGSGAGQSKQDAAAENDVETLNAEDFEAKLGAIADGDTPDSPIDTEPGAESGPGGDSSASMSLTDFQ